MDICFYQSFIIFFSLLFLATHKTFSYTFAYAQSQNHILYLAPLFVSISFSSVQSQFSNKHLIYTLMKRFYWKFVCCCCCSKSNKKELCTVLSKHAPRVADTMNAINTETIVCIGSPSTLVLLLLYSFDKVNNLLFFIRNVCLHFLLSEIFT